MQLSPGLSCRVQIQNVENPVINRSGLYLRRKHNVLDLQQIYLVLRFRPFGNYKHLERFETWSWRKMETHSVRSREKLSSITWTECGQE